MQLNVLILDLCATYYYVNYHFEIKLEGEWPKLFISYGEAGSPFQLWVFSPHAMTKYVIFIPYPRKSNDGHVIFQKCYLKTKEN